MGPPRAEIWGERRAVAHGEKSPGTWSGSSIPVEGSAHAHSLAQDEQSEFKEMKEAGEFGGQKWSGEGKGR